MWTCSHCNERIENQFDACWKCGTSRDGTPAPQSFGQDPPHPTAAPGIASAIPNPFTTHSTPVAPVSAFGTSATNTSILFSPSTLAPYDYLVVPFTGQIQGGVLGSQGTHTVASQLQTIIDQYVTQGWEFYRLENVNILVQPGCLASILGSRAAYITIDQLVFRSRRP